MGSGCGGVGGKVPEECEADVNKEIGAAAGDEEDAEGWDCGGVRVSWESLFAAVEVKILGREESVRKMVTMTTTMAESALAI